MLSPQNAVDVGVQFLFAIPAAPFLGKNAGCVFKTKNYTMKPLPRPKNMAGEFAYIGILSELQLCDGGEKQKFYLNRYLSQIENNRGACSRKISPDRDAAARANGLKKSAARPPIFTGVRWRSALDKP
jgi:hypothetical protein